MNKDVIYEHMFKFSGGIVGTAKAKFLEEDGCLVRVVHLDRVEKARDEIISERELERLSLTFKVISSAALWRRLPWWFES